MCVRSVCTSEGEMNETLWTCSKIEKKHNEKAKRVEKNQHNHVGFFFLSIPIYMQTVKTGKYEKWIHALPATTWNPLAIKATSTELLSPKCFAMYT